MDTQTFTRAADALIARGHHITAQNLREVAEEIKQADMGLAPEPPSLPGQEFRTQVHAFAISEGATKNNWQAYTDALASQDYEIRWAGTSPTTRGHDDDGTGYSAAERGPYAILDHNQPSPAEQPQPSGFRGLLERARTALRQPTERERWREQFRRRSTEAIHGKRDTGKVQTL